MGKKVLAIDDDAEFLDMLSMLVSGEGYTVERCTVSTEAHQRAMRMPPDAIMVDLRMPLASGWQVIEEIRSDPLLAGIPIIVCTAAVLDATRCLARLKHWGCDILAKPFELDDLLGTLGRATGQQQAS